MNLWIFGDSFSELQAPGQLGWEWQLQIANELRCDLYNVAHNGTSSEWITLQLSRHWNSISKEDIVIVLIPNWDRQCIFSDSPDFTHLTTIENCNNDQRTKQRWNKYSLDQRDAFAKYFMYLHDEELVKLKTSSLYSWINNLKVDKVPLVLETRNQSVKNDFYNHYVTATGNLMGVSEAEWKDINIWNTITSRALYHDPRISHLTKRNHSVLANKILEYIKHDVPVDLRTGFHTEIIDEGNIDIECRR